MSKFKKGDRVKCIIEAKCSAQPITVGEVYEVERCENGFVSLVGRGPTWADGGGWAVERFELADKPEPEGEWVEIDREEYHSLVNGGSNGRLKISVESGPGALANRYHKWVPKLEWPTEPGAEFIYTYKGDPEQHRGFVLPYDTGDYAYTSFGGIVTDDARNHVMTLVEVIGK